MRRNWTPSIVPTGHDQTVYLVVDDFRRLGIAYRETDVMRVDLESVISDLMTGDTTTRSASSHSTSPSVGPRMRRKILRGKFCAELNFSGTRCRHRSSALYHVRRIHAMTRGLRVRKASSAQSRVLRGRGPAHSRRVVRESWRARDHVCERRRRRHREIREGLRPFFLRARSRTI